MESSIKSLLAVLLATFFLAAAAQAQGGSFFDDFNDGNADGWIFPYDPDESQGPGIWSVEDGILMQSFTGDSNAALVDNLLLSDQAIEAEVKTNGYAGIVLWHQGNSWIQVIIYPRYTGIVVRERMDGIGLPSSPYEHRTWPDTWYNLRVEANRLTGEIKIYLDGEYILSHFTTVPPTGRSGVVSGNEVGYFDNFSIVAPPDLTDRHQCRCGGWRDFPQYGFKNQGDCIRFVNKQIRCKRLADRVSLICEDIEKRHPACRWGWIRRCQRLNKWYDLFCGE